jgi:hypothetical protein
LGDTAPPPDVPPSQRVVVPAGHFLADSPDSALPTTPYYARTRWTPAKRLRHPGGIGEVRQLLKLHPFDRMRVQHAGEAELLLKPGDARFHSLVYETTDPAVVRDLLTDPHLVPKGLIRDEGGGLRAVFWQRRT